MYNWVSDAGKMPNKPLIFNFENTNCSCQEDDIGNFISPKSMYFVF